jgi:RimJ/RimL family protein N-acetyltransferase
MLAEHNGLWVLDGGVPAGRLLLRAHTPADLDDLVVFHSDAEVTRYIPWPVRDRAGTEAALAVKLTQVTAAVGQWLVLAVEHRADERVIGEVLLKRGPGAEAEVGYAFSRAYQGAGHASEAVSALLAEASRALGVERFTATVDTRNTASLRLLGRLGFALLPARATDAGLARLVTADTAPGGGKVGP